MLKLVPPIRNRARAELLRRASGTAVKPPWTPFPGPQTLAVNSHADIMGFGGQAGGGKTDVLLGLALTYHLRSIIFRREYTQLRDVVGRSKEIVAMAGLPARYNTNEATWRLPGGRSIEFGAVQYDDDKYKYRGRPHDLICFDESTEFLESQVRFIVGWLRTTVPGQRCRVCLTFNPPTHPEGEWVARWFAAWLDPTHPRPAAPGELRWYAMVGGGEVERPDGMPFEHADADGRSEVIRPMSRTFIPARLSDNPALDSSGEYRRTLQSLPEPLRSQLLYGDFTIGSDPDPWQLIPTAWVQAAQRRWRDMGGVPDPRVPMTCVGMDVAHGGKDQTVVAPRWGRFVGQLAKFKGKDTPDGATAAAQCVRLLSGRAFANVDAIGYGASAAERLADPPPAGFGVAAHPINVACRSDYTDRSGKYRMVNLRAEMYWRLREELDPEVGGNLALPPDQELLADLTAPRYQVTTAGIKIEAKEAVAARLGRSPDAGDAVALGLLPPPAVGFGPMLAGERSVGHVGGALPGMGYAPVGHPGGGHPVPGHPVAVHPGYGPPVGHAGAMAPVPGNGRRS